MIEFIETLWNLKGILLFLVIGLFALFFLDKVLTAGEHIVSIFRGKKDD